MGRRGGFLAFPLLGQTGLGVAPFKICVARNRKLQVEACDTAFAGRMPLGYPLDRLPLLRPHNRRKRNLRAGNRHRAGVSVARKPAAGDLSPDLPEYWLEIRRCGAFCGMNGEGYPGEANNHFSQLRRSGRNLRTSFRPLVNPKVGWFSTDFL